MKIKNILIASLLGTILLSETAWSAEEKPIDPESSRIIYGPTALPNAYKNVKLTSFDLGLWQLDYSPNSHLTVGLQAVPPIAIYAVGGVIRTSYSFSSQVHLGVYANAGVAGVISVGHLEYYGGGPMLTLGDHRRAINISVLNYGVTIHDQDDYSSTPTKSVFGMFPGVGGSVQVSNRVKLNMEGYLVTTPQQEKVVKAGAILYGVRIFSETGSVYGDISFLAPIAPGIGNFYRYLPLGIPILAFGFSF